MALSNVEHFETLAEIAGARAETYALLAGIFGKLPDKKLIEKVMSCEFSQYLANCSTGGSAELAKAVDYLKEYITGAKERCEDEVLQELSVDRTRLVRAPGKELVPPYEGLYVEGQEPGAGPLRVKQFYRKAGLLPDDSVCDAPDYLPIQLDFMYQMCRREQGLWRQKISAEDVIEMEKEFISLHLGNWVGKFCSQASKQASTGFFRGFVVMLGAVIETDARFLNQLALTVH